MPENHTAKLSTKVAQVDELMQLYRPVLSEFGKFIMKVHQTCSPEALGYDEQEVSTGQDANLDHKAAHVIDTWVRHAANYFVIGPRNLKEMVQLGYREPSRLHEIMKSDAEDTIKELEASAGQFGQYNDLYQEGVDICRKIAEFADQHIQQARSKS